METIQSRVARNKFCWGLGGRAVRAGSIGRDDPRLEENTASPEWGAGRPWPPPSPRRPQRLMIPTDRPGPQVKVPLGLYDGPPFIPTGTRD